MAHYELAVTAASNVAAVVRLLRRLSPMTVSETARRVGTTDPVLHFDTWAFAPDVTYDDGVPIQQQVFRELISELKSAGASVQIVHRTTAGTEVVSEAMLENLFESELFNMRQEFD